jgi:hypothetical protein
MRMERGKEKMEEEEIPATKFSRLNGPSRVGDSLRVQVKPTQLGPIDRDSPCLASSWNCHRCPKTGTTSIDWAQLSRFYLKT